MHIYIFSSMSFTNICAGVGAGKWAVSAKLAKKRGTVTKAKKMKVGSLGVLYCSKTHEFTTPFLVKTTPEEGVVISDIWPEQWALPFDIVPLGSPVRTLSKNVVARELPSVKTLGRQWDKILHVQPSFSFQTSDINTDDWAFLYERLRT